MVAVSDWIAQFVVLTILDRYRCINNYRDGVEKQSELSAANYGPTYESFLRLLLLVNANPYHKKKWDQVRRQWAKRGMYVFIFTLMIYLHFLSGVYWIYLKQTQ